MKKFVAIMLGAALLPAFAAAQDQGWASKFFNGELKHDFGKVASGQLLTHKFTITNIYDKPFMVEEARVSCGCVSAKKPTTVIPSRGTAVIEAVMDTRKIPLTNQIKTVTIYVKMTSVAEKSGDQIFSSACYLSVSSLPQGNLLFSAEKILLGAVLAGQTPSGSLDIEHFTDAAWKITEIVHNSYPVDVKFEQVQPQRRGRVSFRVTASLKKDAPAGDYKYEIQLKTSDPAMPLLPLVVEGAVQAPLTAAPNLVNLGNVKVGEVVTGQFVVKGAGKPFKITKVDGGGDDVKAKFQDKALPVHLVTVEFLPGKEGKLNKTLTIKTDLAGDLTATVTLEGAGTP
jgi:hypothetical protein